MTRPHRIPVLALLAAVALLACTSTRTPDSRPSFRPPETPSPQDLEGALDGALLVDAISGHWTTLGERTSFVPARLTVWDGGLVTANVAGLFEPPDYCAIKLTDEEFGALRERLLDARVTTYSAQDVTGQPSSCADCNVQIIRTDVAGVVIEVAIGSVTGPQYPESVRALVAVVDDLLNRFQPGKGDPWRGNPPLVQVARPQAGG